MLSRGGLAAALGSLAAVGVWCGTLLKTSYYTLPVPSAPEPKTANASVDDAPPLLAPE
jgi:hypothetical protein